MEDGPTAHRRAEIVGELRYLSIRLHGHVTALPARSLPPRGGVSWSSAELSTLRALAHELAVGQRDADRAAAAMGAIAVMCARDPGASAGESTRLTEYLAQRAIALDTLPLLQRAAGGQPAPAPPRPSVETARSEAPWRRWWNRLTRGPT
jgi:hypothetical protein